MGFGPEGCDGIPQPRSTGGFVVFHGNKHRVFFPEVEGNEPFLWQPPGKSNTCPGKYPTAAELGLSRGFCLPWGILSVLVLWKIGAVKQKLC